MKNFTLYSLALAAVAGGASSEKVMAASEINADGEQTQLRKNVLMIAVDDLKPLLGCYGSYTCQLAYRLVPRPYACVGFENIDSFTESGCCHIAAAFQGRRIYSGRYWEDI